jgi:Arc/MetJ-type ribon-helix-helix transcriptional regulator
MENPIVSARVTKQLRVVMNEYLKFDAHVSEGDFIRDAIREKIERDAPELFKKMFRGASNARGK